ncbi:replication initiator [Frankia sp. CcWB3]
MKGRAGFRGRGRELARKPAGRGWLFPACSAVYKRDARRLVLAGLAGGKGVPETVTGHPAWFVTLTAPSFGPVHSRRQHGGKTGSVRGLPPPTRTVPSRPSSGLS